MFRPVCFLIGYLFGCIQSAYIVGKITANIDIRQYGSGNSGMTNTIRVVGRLAGLIVFITDVLKAVAAYSICSILFDGSGSFFSGAAGTLPGIYAGIGVILGHNFPFFMGFKGGKGAASALGVMLCVNLPAAFITYSCGLALVVIFKYISLSVLVMVVLFPIFTIFFGTGLEAGALFIFIAALTYFMHRSNIQRLLDGSERKFTLKKQITDQIKKQKKETTL